MGRGPGEAISTNDSDKTALKVAGRRFVWMTVALFGGLTIGFWAVHAMFPSILGALTNYTIEVSGIAAIAFGGSYAAALSLRPLRSGYSPTPGTSDSDERTP